MAKEMNVTVKAIKNKLYYAECESKYPPLPTKYKQVRYSNDYDKAFKDFKRSGLSLREYCSKMFNGYNNEYRRYYKALNIRLSKE